MRKLTVLTLAVFAIGCGTNKKDSTDCLYYDGVVVSKSEVRNDWFTHLAENNLALYSAVIRAIIVSEKTGKRVYISRDYGKNVIFYNVTLKNEGGSNVLSVHERNKEIIFDHYNNSDGKTMRFFAEKRYIELKTQKLHKELKVGDYN